VFLKSHPALEGGLHLTLTFEWDKYRWGPLASKTSVPELVDQEGCLWCSVAAVLAHASSAEIDREIRAQLDRALSTGLVPSHLDSYMGTLFASEAYLKVYLQLGI